MEIIKDGKIIASFTSEEVMKHMEESPYVQTKTNSERSEDIVEISEETLAKIPSATPFGHGKSFSPILKNNVKSDS